MKKRGLKRTSWILAAGILLLLSTIILAPTPSQAQTTRWWMGGDSNWGLDSNWGPSGVPQSGDAVIINSGTINYDWDYSTLTAPGSLAINDGYVFHGNGNVLVLQAPVDASPPWSGPPSMGLTVGGLGAGNYYFNGSGTLVSPRTVLGNGLGSYGYIYQNVFSGDGALAEHGELWLGFNGGIGQYYLGGANSMVNTGTLVIGGKEWYGAMYDGVGTFNQYDGTHNVNGLGMFIADTPDSTGYYNLSGGVLNNNGGYAVVGMRGTGTFNQTGGTHNVVNTLEVGGGGTGTYNLIYGELITGSTIVGNFGTGTFNLYAGDLSVGGTTIVGNNGTGTFTQSGGSVNLNGGYQIWEAPWDPTWKQYAGLVLGKELGSSGTYTLTSGNLNVANATIVGGAGNGTFNLGDPITKTGDGVHTTGDLYVGYNTGTDPSVKGVYNLYSGTLNVVGGNGLMGFTVVGGKYVDPYPVLGFGPTVGIGEFNQSGGIHNTGGLFLGDTPGSTGTYNLSGGDLNVGYWDVIGGGGAVGIFNQTGGTHTVLNSGTLEVGGAGTGTYNLISGNLNTNGTIVGNFGTGTFNQGYRPDTNEWGDGGTHSIKGVPGVTVGDLILGNNFGSSGTYNLYAGQLNVDGSTIVGNEGAGFFNQSGGTHTVYSPLFARALVLGNYPTGNGTYNLVSGDLTTGGTFVGSRGTGTFNQGYDPVSMVSGDGGTHTIYGDLVIGSATNSSGTYNLYAGQLSVKSVTPSLDGRTIVGFMGTGIFNQDGGTHTIEKDLILGGWANGIGTYDLSGTGSLSVSGNTIVGLTGKGTFNQSGGTHTVSGDVTIAANPGSSGTYNLSGGTLTATNIVNNDKFNFSGGILNANITNNANFKLSGSGTREVNGTITNNAAAMLEVFNTQVISYGAVTNYGKVTVTAGSTVNWVPGVNFFNYGNYDPEPSKSYFYNLIVGTAGYITGGIGEFYIGGNFMNYSTNSSWDTKNADLFFNGAGTHDFHLSNLEIANTWDELSLLDGAILDLSSDEAATLFVRLLNGDINNLINTGLYPITIDYNNGKELILQPGGTQPVPEPSTLLLLGSGLLGAAGFLRRRFKKN